MPFSPKACAFPLLIAVCMQLSTAQFIPGARCLCEQTVKYVGQTISDFKVIESRPGCPNDEVIVTLKNADTDEKNICLNLERKLAKAYITCWKRINRDESQKTFCLNRGKKAEKD